MDDDKINYYFRDIEDVAKKAVVGMVTVNKAIERIDELLTDICEETAS